MAFTPSHTSCGAPPKLFMENHLRCWTLHFRTLYPLSSSASLKSEFDYWQFCGVQFSNIKFNLYRTQTTTRLPFSAASKRVHKNATQKKFALSISAFPLVFSCQIQNKKFFAVVFRHGENAMILSDSFWHFASTLAHGTKHCFNERWKTARCKNYRNRSYISSSGWMQILARSSQ